ncbi:retrovirus-related pol polyprotein from transposon TNT 1-94 [Tanacetum coccineum]
MVVADEPYVGKANARSGQWVEITMSKVQKLISITDSDERKHVLDYTHVDLYYFEDQRKNLLSKYNSLKQEFSSCESELSDLKNTKALNSSFQNKITKLSLENESLKDEISDLKKRKEKGSLKEIVFNKSGVLTSETNLEVPSVHESDNTTQIPLPSLPKLIGAEPSGVTKCLTITKPKQPTNFVVLVKVKLRTEAKPTPDSSIEKLLLALMKEPKCSTCGSSKHLTKEHPEQIVVKRTLAKIHTQPSHGSSRKSPMIPKPYIPCKYCSFNDHHSDECEFYLGCDHCGRIAYETSDCPKKTSHRRPRIALKKFSEPTAKETYDNGDIEGYGLVICNGITFTKVAYVNGLKYNLISISQLCDANFKVLFTKTQGTIFNQNQEVVLIAPRRRDVYVIDMTSYNEESNACFFAKAFLSANWLWHKRLSNLNFKNINKLAKQNLVAGLPSLTFSKDKTCLVCEKGKHHRASFKNKRSFSINKCLHLLHIDLFGPVKPQSISYNKYTLIIIDEYSRYTWVFCLKKKSDTADYIISFIIKMENLNEVKVKELRSDNGTEFKNYKLEEFCDVKGISQNFSSPYTPKQNNVAERRNRTLIEAARTMKISKYQLLPCFGYPVHIHNHRDHHGKFDEKADDRFFLGYSPVAKAFRVFNIRRQEIEETYHVTFSEDDEAISQISTEEAGNNKHLPYVPAYDPLSSHNISIPKNLTSADSHHAQDSVPPVEHDELQHTNIDQVSIEPDHLESADTLEHDEVQTSVLNEQTTEASPLPSIPSQPSEPPIPQDRWSRDRHIELVNIIGEPLDGVTTRSRIRDTKAALAHECLYVNFLSQIEPKRLIEAL